MEYLYFIAIQCFSINFVVSFLLDVIAENRLSLAQKRVSLATPDENILLL